MARRTKIYHEWEYFQPNPKHEKAGDCQIRAVCATTGLDWYTVFDKMVEFCRENCYVWYSNEAYNYLEDKFGFTKLPSAKRVKGKKATTVQMFCKEHPTGKFIVSTVHHVVGIKDGKYYDSWNSGEEAIYRIYELKS